MFGRMRTLTLVVAMTAACGGARGRDPESVLRAYGEALEDGRAADAYKLLSEDARRGLTKDAFLRLAKEHPDEVRDIGRSLLRPARETTVTATATTTTGEEIRLVLEGGVWRIDRSAIDFYAQDTARHALEGFARALEHRRYDMLMRYVSDAHRDGLDAKKLEEAWEGPEKEHMGQVLAGLKQALPLSAIEEVGDRATFAYGSAVVQLVREHGIWRIENFD